MQILQKGDDEFLITVTPEESRALVNCMIASIKEIPPTEFRTRVGVMSSVVNAMIAEIARAL